MEDSISTGWTLPKPATDHPGPDRSTSRGHTQNCWWYRWWTGKTRINSSSTESLIFHRLHSCGPLLPSLTHPSILGWNSCKVAAKNTSRTEMSRWSQSFSHQHHYRRNNLAAETSYKYYCPSDLGYLFPLSHVSVTLLSHLLSCKSQIYTL